MAACGWVSEIVPCEPYRTQTRWVDHFGAHLAVHGDDIAVDDTGQDSLAEMKTARRFCLIKRFKGPGTISTTDLIDRMLHARTDHHLPRSILTKANRKINSGEAIDEELLETSRMLEKINLFACGNDGSNNSTAVFEFIGDEKSFAITEIAKGRGPSSGQRIVYVDGSFDLFTAGHVAFLKAVISIEKKQHTGLEPYLIVDIYDDTTVSKCKGTRFPVMNMTERALLLLQSRVSWKDLSFVIFLSFSNQLAVCQRCCSLGSTQTNIKTFFNTSPARNRFGILRSRRFRRITLQR